MNHGIRTIRSAAFASCALLVGCAHAPDPVQLSAVNNLISATEGALLTLNELDRGRYSRSDSLFTAQHAHFDQRFQDTLDRQAAFALGSQFIALRHAGTMGQDHERVATDITTSLERLRTLHADIANGAMEKERGATLIAHEQQRHTILIHAVHAVMDNYRTLQHAWDRRDTVATLLADTNPAIP